MIADGGQRHLAKDLQVPFQERLGPKIVQTPAFVRSVIASISEESIRARKKRVRGEISQVVQVMFVTSKPYFNSVPELPHVHYPGTNRGDSIAWIHLTPPDQIWEMTFERKKQLYKDKMVASGTVAPDTKSVRKDDDLEPTFYSFLPETFYADLIQSHNALAFIDLTPGPGEACKAALVLKKPYLGLCLGETHVLELQNHLVSWVMQKMAQEGHQLYNAKYAACKAQEDKKEEKDKKDQKDLKDVQKDAAKKTKKSKGSDSEARNKGPRRKKQNKKRSKSTSSSESQAKKRRKKVAVASSDSDSKS